MGENQDKLKNAQGMLDIMYEIYHRNVADGSDMETFAKMTLETVEKKFKGSSDEHGFTELLYYYVKTNFPAVSEEAHNTAIIRNMTDDHCSVIIADLCRYAASDYDNNID